MDDPIREAILRARELAAKATQNAPVKRKASELDGTVKVTHAYEKPPPERGDRDAATIKDRGHDRDSRDRDTRGRDSRDRSHDRSRDRSRDRDRYRERDKISNRPSSIDNNNDRNSMQTKPEGSLLNPSGGQSMLGGHNYSTDEKIEIIIPHAVIGLVIGKGGENIKRIQSETGAAVRVDPNVVDERGNKMCTITGTKRAVEDAHNQVASVIESSTTNKRPRTQVEGSDQYRMKIPVSRTGAIIGKGGETIKSIKQQSGCDIELEKGSKDAGPDESVFIIRGTADKIQKAKSLMEARLAVRGRDGDSSGRSYQGAPKGVATGANAAPVGQFDLGGPSYPAAGQQNPADVSAAWAAYYTQFNSVYGQAGAAVAGATAGAPGGVPYVAGGPTYPGVVGDISATTGPMKVESAAQTPPAPHPQAPPQPSGPGSQTQQDFSDQWIEYYIAMGLPAYADQIRQMKRQLQQPQGLQQGQQQTK